MAGVRCGYILNIVSSTVKLEASQGFLMTTKLTEIEDQRKVATAEACQFWCARCL